MDEIHRAGTDKPTRQLTRRSFLRAGFGVGAVALLAACAPSAPAPAAKAPEKAPAAAAPAQGKGILIRIGHSSAVAHVDQVWSETFKKISEEKSGGRLQVQIFPNAQLGDQQRSFEAVRLGTLEITSGGIPVPQWVPEYGIERIPYLYRNLEHFVAATEGPINAIINPKLEKEKMKPLGRAYIGVRHMTTNSKPINTPDDMKGLKMRTVDVPVYHAMYRALGANPVGVSFSELYMALRQGVTDGQDNPVMTIRAQKLHEVQKYLSLTGHVYGAQLFVYSLKLFNELSADLQKIVLEAGAEASRVARKSVVDSETADTDFLKAQGMIINKPDIEPFIKATAKVPEMVKDEVPLELVEKIRALK